MNEWFFDYLDWIIFYVPVVLLLFFLFTLHREWKIPLWGYWINDKFVIIGTVKEKIVLSSGMVRLELEQPCKEILHAVQGSVEALLNEKYRTRTVFVVLPQNHTSPLVGAVVRFVCREWYRYFFKDCHSVVLSWEPHIGKVPYVGHVTNFAPSSRIKI